jgi:hypothetical protein
MNSELLVSYDTLFVCVVKLDGTALFYFLPSICLQVYEA